jgi:hypothetical protein
MDCFSLIPISHRRGAEIEPASNVLAILSGICYPYTTLSVNPTTCKRLRKRVIRVIKELSVKNFKSIKELKIDCRRVNLFIGGPNTGKSNILETLGLLSWYGHGNVPLKEYVRFGSTDNLFYDKLTDESVEIQVVEKTEDQKESVLRVCIEFKPDLFRFDTDDSWVRVYYSGGIVDQASFPLDRARFIKCYTFERQEEFSGVQSSFLMPPHGSNMFVLVMGSRKLRASMARFFKDARFQLALRPHAKAFEFQKRIEDEDIDSIIQFPYILASDTLQRMIFYTIAIESNENSTLVFEEPESHAFPYYTKYLGEKIAFDETNQYFIATHNPYLLFSILEKTPKDDANVFVVTYSKDYETKVKCLNDDEVSKLMSYEPDFFLNLDSFFEDEEEEL